MTVRRENAAQSSVPMASPPEADTAGGNAPRVAALAERLFRERSARMVAYLTRVFGPQHLELAEEVVQDALVRAIQVWPYRGLPADPSAWLLAVARNRALDVLRRESALRDREPQIAATLSDGGARSREPAAFERELHDDELRLIFLCCHPLLGRDARVALSLKVAAGFGVREIARAFLADETTIAQRIVRAKRRLRTAGADLELPSGDALTERLDPVLEVLYLIFNEGYAAHAGDDLVRTDLCLESLRLARLVAASPLTARPRVHALVALLALQAARLPARVNAEGEMVLLEDQERTLWDAGLLAIGFHHLERSATGPQLSTYHVQAAIAAVHAAAPDAASTNWREILSLYDQLVELQPSPVVRLNRAVALARVRGPAAGLAELDGIERHPDLRRYYLLPAVRGGLLLESGDPESAAVTFRRALTLPCAEPERRFLERRLRECGPPTSLR